MYQIKVRIMIKRFVRLIFAFGLLLSGLPVHAQEVGQPAHAQEGSPQSMYLHMAKNFYMPGEILWFRVYAGQADSSLNSVLWTVPDSRTLPSENSVAYVEILNAHKERVLTTKVEIGPSKLNGGSVYIPAELQSDTYSLVAYTASMKNQGPAEFFSAEFEVLNPYFAPDNAGGHAVAEPALQLFPEGGMLLDAVPTRIAFKLAVAGDAAAIAGKSALENAGPGYDVIVREDSAVVARVRSNAQGIGSFQITPHKGRQYQTEVLTPDGRAIIAGFPVISDEGLVMNVGSATGMNVSSAAGINGNAVEIYRRTVEISGSAVYAGHQVQMLVSQWKGGVARAVDTLALRLDREGRGKLVLSTENLPDGLLCLTLHNDRGQKIAERLIFNYPEQRLIIRSAVEQNDLRTRDRVDLDIQALLKPERATPGLPAPLNPGADLSIAVYKVDALQHGPNGDFYTYYWLQSGLADIVENIDYYFDEEINLTKRTGDLDLLLMTLRPKDRGWNEKVLPEIRYHRLAFRLTAKNSGEAIANEDVFLSLPGKRSSLFTGTTDDLGRVEFYVKDIIGAGVLAIRLEEAREMDVELISPFFQIYNAASGAGAAVVAGNAGSAGSTGSTGNTESAGDVMGGREPEPGAALSELILSHSLNVQIENSYFAKQRAQFTPPVTDNLPFYGKAEVVYRLDDYTRFVLMEEVLKEYIWEIRATKRRSGYTLRVLDKDRGTFFSNPPLILLDGVPLSSADEIIAFDPLRIEKISIVASRYYLGKKVYDGIVDFSTYEGQLRDFPLESAITLIEYDGLQPDRVFFQPQHQGLDQRSRRLPDTRNLLYWNPSVRTDESGKVGLSFYASDIAGDYIVVIQGVSSSGEIGSSTYRFSVSER